MENKTERIFINGLAPKLVGEKAPDFIRAEFGIHVEDLMKWLSDNRHLANEKGYINGQFLKSKDKPTLYAQVNTYKPKEQTERTYQPEDFPIATEQDTLFDNSLPDITPRYPDGTPM